MARRFARNFIYFGFLIGGTLLGFEMGSAVGDKVGNLFLPKKEAPKKELKK